jgi:serine/threonine protein kinase/Tfp pilus assembly protein PilF
MIGQTISHYEVLEKLGEGGMGVVYKAHDTKLDRIVALKFLPQQITVSAEDKARFLQEAKAISALNHSNIATIHDIDEVDAPAYADASAGRHQFLVLEYIPGGTLKSKLKYLKSEDKEFSLPEVLDYSIQAAEALAHAHRHQIIHRDVKTDNLMLTEEGKVKLTDFGLAKLRGSVQVTKTDTTVGTAAYMSPEQIRGEEVDHRSDIFSLGVVLYELLTSRLPFRGEFETALSYSILNENPPPAKSLRKDTPPALEKVIDRCLEKEKTKRYQTGEEVVDALREIQQQISPAAKIRKKGLNIPLLVGSALVVVAVIVVAYLFWPAKPTTAVEKSIAVLPFVDISPQKDQEYFCDGITEELIDRLSKLRELKVPARTSAFAFKGKSQDIREIGRQLNVQTVLEGSVRKDSSKLRITAQLINVADGYHIWSNTYDRELRDIFPIQDEISLAIVNALRLTLNFREQTNLTKHGTTDLGAYELYFKGKRFRYTERPEQMLQARDYFDEAIRKDPNYAAAYAGLAENYMVLGLYSVLPRDEAALKAKQAAQKALETDENSSEVHVSMGVIKMVFDWDWKGAEMEFKQAIALNPGNFDGHREYALLLLRTYRHDQSEQEFIRSRELDPLNALALRDVSWLYRSQGRDEKAKEVDKKLAELDPYWARREESSVEEAQKELQDHGRNLWLLRRLAIAYHRSGNTKQATKLIKELESLYQRTLQGNVAYVLASYHCNTLHETAKSLTWLERAVEGKAPGLINVSVSDAFDSLQREPRFQAVLKKVGLR